MPTKGQILTDQFTGNIVEFVDTSVSSYGKRVTLKATFYSKGRIVPDHIHVMQDESFKVISGKLTYFLKAEEHELHAGEEITLPKNVGHNHYNTHDEPLVIMQTFEPALDMDYFIENLMGLINDGKAKNGNISFLQAMVTIKYLDSPSYLASLPRSAQNVLASIIAPVARIFGYRAIYKKYTGLEK